MLSGFDGLRVGSDLIERVALQVVVHPASLFAIREQPRVFQHFEMEGQPGLRDAEYLLQLADAALLVRQHFDDPHARLVGERVEPARHLNGLRTRRSDGGPDPNASSFLDTSRPGASAAQTSQAPGAPAGSPDRCPAPRSRLP